jgi:hypothetical protein
MNRLLRWGLALVVASGLLIGGLLLLPLSTWLPGGTVGDIPSAQVVNGSAFNRLFPVPGTGEQLVFSKFNDAPALIKGWPLVDQGDQASALLVGGRFQVKVIGQGAGLDVTQRHELLAAFDLPGLAALPQPGGAKALAPSSDPA